jgi:hypothetical protein
MAGSRSLVTYNSFYMKATPLFLIIILFVSFSSRAQSVQCDNIIFFDNFSSASSWLSEGDGSVYVNNEKCLMQDAYCGYYNRIYQSMLRPLPESYWRAECDFSILYPNPEGHGTGAVVLALTADTLDFMSYDLLQNYEETFQDGIAVVLMSDGSADNDINNWYFMIEAKKGDFRTFDPFSVIYANSSIPTYHIRLERTSKASTQLSIFSDSSLTEHLPGSPVSFEIDSAISKLKTIQHGVITPGFYPRLINAAIDNDLICSDYIYNSNPMVKAYENKLRIYPNPSSSRIYVKRDDFSEFSPGVKYSVFNSMGKEIIFSELGTTGALDISMLPAGIYFLIIKESQKIFNSPFVRTE